MRPPRIPQARTPEDYQAALLAAYPPGIIFPRDPNSIRGRLMLAAGDALSRAEGTAVDLFVQELDPRTATFMFPEWVALTGVTEQPSHDETVALIMTRLLNLGGQSIDYFIAVAASIGYAITLVKHRPRRFGLAHFGDAFGLGDWAFVWDVVSALVQLRPRTFGSGRFGEPFATWANERLEQIIRRFAPGHSLVRFIYT